VSNNRQWSDFIDGISRKIYPTGLMKQNFKERFESIKSSGSGKIKDYPHETHPMFDEYAHYSEGKKSKRVRLDGTDGNPEVKSEMFVLLKLLILLFGVFGSLGKIREKD
jgi:hypothetical protein